LNTETYCAIAKDRLIGKHDGKILKGSANDNIENMKHFSRLSKGLVIQFGFGASKRNRLHGTQFEP
jgi:hypothetical protein